MKNFGDGWLYFWFSIDEQVGYAIMTNTYWVDNGKGAKVKKVEESAQEDR